MTFFQQRDQYLYYARTASSNLCRLCALIWACHVTALLQSVDDKLSIPRSPAGIQGISDHFADHPVDHRNAPIL